MGELPAGTVTLLFTDIDGSTRLLKKHGERYGEVLATHRELLRAAFAEHGGAVVDAEGDAFFVAFTRARDAAMAAIAAQRALAGHAWEGDAPSVRIGLHTGEPYAAERGYTGVAVHRAARICSMGHGGQALLSRSTAGIVDDEDLPGLGLRDLGEHRLKDFDRPERIFQLVADGLPAEFPPLRSWDDQRPLTGTVTVVLAEGRRMMRRMHELTPEHFGAFLGGFQRLVQKVFEDTGGHEVEVAGDSVTAAFATAKEAALAAVAVHAALAAHEWPDGLQPEASIGVHSGTAGIGWVGLAVMRCTDLCDTAEGGETFMSQATAGLLEDEDLGDHGVRDLGTRLTRRMKREVRAYELVARSAADARR